MFRIDFPLNSVFSATPDPRSMNVIAKHLVTIAQAGFFTSK